MRGGNSRDFIDDHADSAWSLMKMPTILLGPLLRMFLLNRYVHSAGPRKKEGRHWSHVKSAWKRGEAASWGAS